MPAKVFCSDEFAKQLRSFRGNASKGMLNKAIEKIMGDPLSGKPLSYELAGKRSLRISHFRIIYAYEKNTGTITLHSAGIGKTSAKSSEPCASLASDLSQ